MPYVLYGIILIALVILVRNIRIVPQAQAYVITRLGAYKTTWGVGLHLKIPFIESVAKRLSLKEQVADFPPQPVITKDNVTMQIDTVVYYQITDPKLYTYGIEQPILAIENLSATTLRNLIGDLELDQCLTSRDIVNTKMRQILDEATDPWGIKVNRVELKNILPPKEIQSAMEKQMKAERERREAILRAEGEKRSAILTAEGEKESAILRADAKKQEQILEAQGRAEAILTVQRATAEGIRLINESMPSDAVIKLKSLEAFAAAADGRATKIIIPSEIQGKKFFEEFKAFAMRGNVLDMAVGVVIGGAFTAIVNSLVNDIINPAIGLFFNADFSDVGIHVGDVMIGIGSFINAIINFLIVAFVLFVVIKFVNALHKKPAEPEAPAEPTTKVCPYCQSEISIKAVRCPHCTSKLEGFPEINN